MKKNILFVLHTLPWPLEYGGNQAMFNGIYALKDVANVYVTYPEWLKDTKQKAREEMIEELGGNIQIFPYIRKRDYSSPRKIVKNLFKIVDNHFFRKDKDFIFEGELSINQVPQEHIDLINEIIKTYHIDIVQVEIITQLSVVNSLPDEVRKVFVQEEIGYVRKEQLLDIMHGNSYYRSVAECSKIQEIGLMNKYDDVIVFSEADKKKLEEAGVTVPVHSSFAIIKAPLEFKPHIEGHKKLCFIGAPEHRPNYLAMIWFLENCWNKLLQRDSEYELKIIGNWSKKDAIPIKNKYNNIVFTGFVEDLGSELENSIMIVPITVGSGIRMKILEAAANGIPVVSTSIGAEGLPLINGENAFIADDADEFVNDVIKLKDRSLRLKFVTALNDVIRKKYSLDALKKNRMEIFNLK